MLPMGPTGLDPGRKRIVTRGPLRLEEMMNLYEKLSVEERDELLQCLLIAAPRGG